MRAGGEHAQLHQQCEVLFVRQPRGLGRALELADQPSKATRAAFCCSRTLDGLVGQTSASAFADQGSGKISSVPAATPSKIARATSSGAAFSMGKSRLMS